MKNIYLHDGVTQQGPFEFEELKVHNVTTNTLVWFEPLTDWTPASQIPELQSLFKIPLPVTNSALSVGESNTLPTFTPPSFLERHRTKLLIGAITFLVGIATVIFIKSTTQQQIVEDLERQVVSASQKAADLNKEVEASNQKLAADAEKQQRAEEAKKQQAEAVAAKEAEYRNNWYNYITVDIVDFKALDFGGFSSIELRAKNATEYPIDFILAQVTYWKANGDIYKIEEITINSLRSKSVSTASAPNSARGTKLSVDIKKVSSRNFNFCFDKEDIPGTDHVYGNDRDYRDPWKCIN